GSLGDILHALPMLVTLKENFPHWEVDWLLERRWKPLLEANPYLSRLQQVDTLAWRRKPLSGQTRNGFAQVFQSLQDRGYDVALDLQGALKSAAACYLSGAREVIGLDRPWLREPAGGVFYTRRVPTNAVHIVEANLAVAQALGAQHLHIRFPLPEGDEKSLPADIAQNGVAILNPGAGWRSKCWPVERYAAVADLLEKEFLLKVALNAGPGEEPLARAVQAACRHSRPLLYSGSLGGLIALLRRATLFIGGDTGPLHLAAALAVPAVALFGPTDPQRNGPYGNRHRVLRPENAETSYRHSSEPGTVMDGISVEQVAEAASQLLQERPRSFKQPSDSLQPLGQEKCQEK
ncbi:MAG: glycosyltransferase family 9 protein, partial [Acidobacteria bacterium]|nr:glycosyltransferase family 9 protein [Acidobacteriota bacterium]